LKRLAASLSAAIVLLTGIAFAANWRIAPEQSRLGFTAIQAGAPFEGSLKRFTADIRFDAKDLAASRAVVIIDMASAETGSLERDVALQGADWFAVSRFPQARFETKGFRSLGGDRFEAEADLTIRDITRTVVLPFTLEPVANGVRARGELIIDRTTFGVGQGQWASPQWIPFPVTVRFDLLATPLP
jgi:polyisoprenoid-binding protein YceI